MNDLDGPFRRCACGKVLKAGEWDAHIHRSAMCRQADRAEHKRAVRELQAARSFRDGMTTYEPARNIDGFRPFNGLHANYRPPRKARGRRK